MIRRTRSPASNAALSANAAESSTNTQPAPTVKISSPASAGPASCATLLDTPINEFARCRCSALTTPATSGDTVGIAHADAAPASACDSAITRIRGSPLMISTATTAWVAHRTRSATSATNRGCSRSASTPPSGSSTSLGTSAHTNTVASAPADPVASTIAKLNAAGTSASLIVERLRPTNNRRKSRSRKGWAMRP
ncbi:hypothetical protein GCM10010483_67770 [Actinokineospora diospyrosa]